MFNLNREKNLEAHEKHEREDNKRTRLRFIVVKGESNQSEAHASTGAETETRPPARAR